MDSLQKKIEKTAERLAALQQAARAQQAAQWAAGRAQRPSVQRMQQTAWINSRQPIAWPDWPPGVWAKGTAVLQKVTRRLLQWYVDPIVQQQNEFNKATLDAVQLLAQEVDQLRQEAARPTANRKS